MSMSSNSYAYKNPFLMFAVWQDYNVVCGALAVSPTVLDQRTTLLWAVATKTAPNLALILAYFTTPKNKTTDHVIEHGSFC